MTSTKAVRFDDALPTLVRYLKNEMTLDVRTDGVFLRDGFGRIAFYLRTPLSAKQNKIHEHALASILGGAAFPAGVLQSDQSAGGSILGSKNTAIQWVSCEGEQIPVSLVDRRFFGRDWLFPPQPPIQGAPPILSFGSLKGGVGRTSALFVLAMHLSRQGRNVLLIDLDLEAPGLAPLVFDGSERPRYGVLDYLVENGLGGITDSDLADFVGTSRLTDRSRGGGRVDLAPATGMATIENPANMLAKLARALVEDPTPRGATEPLASQIRTLVQRIATRVPYDAVLVDARAGLAELTAGALLALGGSVALFGTNHPHTFEGYRYLMAHLATLAIADPKDDWRQRIHFVHSKASVSKEQRREFDDRLYELLSETFYEADEGDDVFTFSLDDEQAPHRAWRIFFDGRFADMDPIADRSLIEEDVYKAAFGDFLASAVEAISPSKSASGSDNAA